MPNLKKWETKQQYISRCIKQRQWKEGKKESRDKSYAVCLSMYKKKKK